MKIKLDKKHALLVLFIAALIVFALTGEASATAQLFFFHNGTYVHTAADDSTTHACDKNMSKNPGPSGPANTTVISSTETAWWYNSAAQVDSSFGEHNWGANISYKSTGAGTVTVDIYLVRNNGSIIKNLASGSNATLNTTTPKYVKFNCSDNTSTNQGFKVGQRLAVRVSYIGEGDFTIRYHATDARSRVKSPTTDPGFPVPELPTIILTSTGLLALVGYVVYSRRRNNK